MNLDLAAGVVILVVIALGLGKLVSLGRVQQRDKDSEKTRDTLDKAQDAKRTVDRMSDDAVRKRLRDRWTRP